VTLNPELLALALLMSVALCVLLWQGGAW